eukprot:4931590-Prymnesium_polylepis.1
MRETYRTHTRGRDTAECGARRPKVHVELFTPESTRVCYGPTGRGTRTGHASGTRNRHGGATRGR